MEASTEVEGAAERLERLFAAVQAHGAPGTGPDITYLFELTGECAGTHLLKVEGHTATWDHAPSAGADVTIRLATDDLLAIADGRMDGRFAVSSERIEIEGDLEQASNMISRFRADLALPE